MSNASNVLAKTFKDLHKPHNPVILANVYDGISAKAVASLPASQAIATASYSVAAAAGTTDPDLSREELIRSAKVIASSIREFGKPLTVDARDGYGEHLEEMVRELVEAGVVGINLEDCDNSTKQLYSTADAFQRIKQALRTAKALGVPDFVVNARCDALLRGGGLEEVISRGQAYLAAGATTVFVLGGSGRGGITKEEVGKLVEAFDGRLNVSAKLSPGSLTSKDLAAMGVARISVGPALHLLAVEKFREIAEQLMSA